MKKIILVLTAISLGYILNAQQMVKVNKWVSPVFGDFVSIPENKATDAALISWGYKNKVFQYEAYLTPPKGDVTKVNRWIMPNCKEYIIIAEHEIDDATMTSRGYKGKEFLFYAYKTPPAKKVYVAVSRWINALPEGNKCKDFTLSGTKMEHSDAELISWGYKNKIVQFYVPINSTNSTTTNMLLTKNITINQKSSFGNGNINFSNKKPISYAISPSQSRQVSNNNGVICTETPVSINGGTNEFSLMSPTATIVPGIIFDINTIETGGFRELSFTRNAMDLNTTVIAGNASPSRERVTGNVNAPIMIDKMKVILQRIGYNVRLPFQETFNLEEISNYEQLQVMAGASYSGWGTQVQATFNYLNESQKNKFGVVYKNKILDAVIAAPNGAYRDLIGQGITVPDNAVVVSKVSYGKIIVLTIETDMSKEEMQAVINYAGSYGVQNIEANLDLKKISLLKKTNIKVLSYGGSGSILNTVSGTGKEGLASAINWLRGEGGNIDIQNGGILPISYQLNFINDGSIASINSTLSFTKRTCITNISNFNIKLVGFVYGTKTGGFEGYGVNLFGDLALVGGTGIQGNLNQNIWNISPNGPYTYGIIASCSGKPLGEIAPEDCQDMKSKINNVSNAVSNLIRINVDNTIPASTVRLSVNGRLRRQMGMGGWDYQPYNAEITMNDIMRGISNPSRRFALKGINVHNEVMVYPVFEVTME